MKELIPLAVLLVDLAGGHEQAEQLLARAMTQGRVAVDAVGIRGDRRLLVDRKMTEAGLFGADGQPDRVKLAEMTVLLDLLKAVPAKPGPPPPETPLLFTLPQAAGDLVQLGDRIDRRINDLIACAQRTLTIGGPFWNEAGFAMLRPVLHPALRRGVQTSFFAHPQGVERDELLTRFIDQCRREGDVSLAWWHNGAPSLMHAKFVLADSSCGYLGTANLTSLGLDAHLEIGVPLSVAQCRTLEDVLGALIRMEFFVPSAESPARLA